MKINEKEAEDGPFKKSFVIQVGQSGPNFSAPYVVTFCRWRDGYFQI